MEKINFFSEDVNFELSHQSNYQKWIEEVIHFHNKIPGNINFIFCSDEHLLTINVEYLNHDYYTDIITFDYTENSIISGDLFISIDRVKDNANTIGTNFIDELNRVCIHGVLHLLGYKDSTEEEKNTMRSLENDCLKKLKENDASRV